MNFRKINNIAGWVVFVFASLVYILTAEMRGSFWDCGEFVSACYKVQLPHPPGAPLFVLLGRFANERLRRTRTAHEAEPELPLLPTDFPAIDLPT